MKKRKRVTISSAQEQRLNFLQAQERTLEEIESLTAPSDEEPFKEEDSLLDAIENKCFTAIRNLLKLPKVREKAGMHNNLC